MCGITGFLSKQYKEPDLMAMALAIEKRGPDAEGFFFNAEDGIGLGHRRLSILDLSESANQPFYSSCDRFVIVFNGEIYNFREIRENILKEKIIEFRTKGDTEVVVEAYALWGKAFFDKLNGMFALAIWDRIGKELFFCRDRIGIKPLYFFQDQQNLAFSSEMKALRKLSSKPLTINKKAIADFLYLGYVPTPFSIYNEVSKLPAGHYATLKEGCFKIKPYWQLQDQLKSDSIVDFAAAKVQLHELLLESIQRQMVADVPVGTFLSGGIDSSIVTAIAQSVSDKKVNTFSIGFKESKFNESQHARKIANYLGTHHHEFILSEQDAIEQIGKLIDVFDEPFADASAIPTLLVSEMARKHVKVALSGDGGDEQFLGYGMYNWAERLNRPWLRAMRRPIATLLKASGASRNIRAAGVFNYPDRSSLKSHIFSQEQHLFSAAEICQLLVPGYRSGHKLEEDFFKLARALSPAEEQALFDLQYYLPDNLLVKVDRASMFHSLEVRVPLLDHELVSFSLNLDRRLKRKKESKRLLKAVLYDYIPESHFNRPKRGFSIPLAKWLKSDLSYLFNTTLSDESVLEVGIVNVQVVRNLKKDFLNGKDYLFNRLWALILLHKWAK